jgi:uncharacterized protein (DUF1697 family)
MRYVAFLRAINVGGRVVKMHDLRKAFESLRVSNVQTFIASGNVIFDGSTKNIAALERQAEARLAKAFGYPIDTFIRSMDEVAAITTCPAFLDATACANGATVYVGFLREEPGSQARTLLASLANDVDDFRVTRREVLWWCHKTFAESTVAGGGIEKALGMRATFRNSRTISRIASKYSG